MRMLASLGTVGLFLCGSVLAAAEPNPSNQSPKLTPGQLDCLIGEDLGTADSFSLVTDEQFLRRLSLDLIGRQPTTQELNTFLNAEAADKRSRAVERLLASPEFGENWANYWSDTISYRVPPPELTFLNYDPLKTWLAREFNGNTPWDEIVRQIIVGTGKVQDQPPATFVAYHQGNPVKLASETARIFLAVQIQCAQCHDHPFENWKREQFHQLAAFFVRTDVKMPWNKGAETVVKDKEKGEYVMPNAADPTKKGKKMDPAVLTGVPLEPGRPDQERRARLAEWLTDPDNPWFAKTYVNRVWAVLMGRGFFEPVDDASHPDSMPAVHAALTDEFRRSGFDVKSLFRLIVNTQTYQSSVDRSLRERHVNSRSELTTFPLPGARIGKLRGDQVFAALVTAIGLPNVTPPAQKATDAVRFPPPPKSTRDFVAETFGFDPSLSPDDVRRNMQQAMLLMNNEQLHAQINADPASGTALSKLLQAEPDNKQAVMQLFQMVLARRPNNRELGISLKHIDTVNNRGTAFEDLLWSLINSTEFTAKR